MTGAQVVVTGLGMTTPVGGDTASSWASVLAGRSGARLLDDAWAADLPVALAARVAVDPETVLDRVAARKLDRGQRFAVVAAREAWADAGAPDVAPERLAVVIGSGLGGVTSLLESQDVLRERGSRRISPHMLTMLIPNSPAAAVSLELSARARSHAPSSACASGAEAIAQGLDLIRNDHADVVVCGGTEAAIHPVLLAGFAAMNALSRRTDEPGAASRPFDKDRDGFVLGEGAGILVLERADTSRARGAHAYAALAGAGTTSDAHHVAAPDPRGRGAGRAAAIALRDADAVPGDVVHVNAHATGTPAGDLAEARALRHALGDRLDGVPVSGTKGSTGHLLGAAGAVEAAFTVLALAGGSAPPTRNLDNLDDDIPLDVVTMTPRRLRGSGVALSTSFGFGGHNVALAFRSAGQPG